MFTRRFFADPPSASDPAPDASVLPAPTRPLRYGRIVFCAWVIVLAVVCVRVGLAPLRQSVYAADYLPAGQHWLHGEEIYRLRHNFLYSPPTAAFFAPFALVPAGVSGIVWRLLCAAVLLEAASGWLRSRLSGLGQLPAGWDAARTLPTAFLLLLPAAVGNVNLGQMNLMVLALAAFSVLAVRRERWNLAAVLLAVAAFVKIYPLALGLLLALLYPRQLSWRLALALAGVFAVSLALQRPAYVWAEYHEWFAVLGRDDRLDTDIFSSWRDFGFLLRASGVPLSNHAYRLMEAAAGVALAAFLWWGQRWRRWAAEKLLGAVFCLGCAWMILFGPATEAATYVVLSLPVCGSLLAAWSLAPGSAGGAARALRAIFTAAYGLLLAADAANSWFHKETHHLFMRALQPLAAVLFTGGVVWWLLRPEAVGMEPSAAETVNLNSPSALPAATS